MSIGKETTTLLASVTVSPHLVIFLGRHICQDSVMVTIYDS